jgi:hypothetical protein
VTQHSISWLSKDTFPKCGVGPSPRRGANIYSVDEDGTLFCQGPDYKECPAPEKPCPRPSRDMPKHGYDPKHPKCRMCSYSGHYHVGDVDNAIHIAEILQNDIWDDAPASET